MSNDVVANEMTNDVVPNDVVTNEVLPNDTLAVVDVPGDGSCFFHAIGQIWLGHGRRNFQPVDNLADHLRRTVVEEVNLRISKLFYRCHF